MNRKEKTVAISAIVVIMSLILIGLFLVPFMEANGVAGPLDSPSFLVMSVGMSRGQPFSNISEYTCYLNVVIRNNGNVNVKSLSISVNGTEMLHTNLVIASGQWYSSTFGDLHVSFFACPNISAGEAYPFFLQGHFADGQIENYTTTVYVTPAYETSTSFP